MKLFGLNLRASFLETGLFKEVTKNAKHHKRAKKEFNKVSAEIIIVNKDIDASVNLIDAQITKLNNLKSTMLEQKSKNIKIQKLIDEVDSVHKE